MPRDVKRGFDLMKAAADQRPGIADYYVDMLYANGTGVEKDDEQAFKYFMRSAEAGTPEGIGQLGLLYQLGRGTKVDHVKGRELLTIAAELGQAGAAFALGMIYENGLGVQADTAQAVVHYERAAKAGIKEARDRLSALRKSN